MPQEVRDLDYLESLIDQHGIRGVLQMLADLCTVKADHVRENWQDPGLASLWGAADRAIHRAMNHTDIQLLSCAEGRKKDVRS